MKLSRSELVDRLAMAAKKVVSEEDAQYYAVETVEAQLRKAPRTNPLKSSVGDLEACIKHKNQEIRYTTDLPSFISIDFQRHGPLIHIKKIHDDLVDRSTTNGIAMAAFTNSQSMHTLHTWVQGLAKRGLVAIAICNGGPNAVIPFNGTKGMFGTNPMAFGFPGANGKIHCVDMATSEIPYFEVLAANKNKEPLRPNSAVDEHGEFTLDASKALDYSLSASDPNSNIVPMGGGYKGYYLVYLMELLTSGLIGMPSSPEMSRDYVAEEHGAILLVLNPKAMGTENNLVKSIGELHEAIKAQKPKAGTTIRIPGEENSKRYTELINQDIEVDIELIQKLDALST